MRRPLPSYLLKEVSMRKPLWLSAWLVVLAITPVALAAQTKWEFTPFVGLYAPTSDVLEISDVLTAGDKLTAKHETAFVFGGRLGVSVSKQVVIEGSFGYALSGVKATYTDPSTGSSTGDTTGHVIVAGVRALVAVGPTDRSTSWHVIVGSEFVSHGSPAYEGLGGLTDFGGVVGFGAKFKAGKSLAVRVDLEDNLYSGKFEDTASGAQTTSKFQNDISILAGLVVPLGSGSK
jgi:hypothetical protein